MRGLAIVAMLQAHIWEYYIAAPSGSGLFFHNFFVGPAAGFSAPFFILISGLSAWHAWRRRPAAELHLRGLFLFSFSTLVFAVSARLLPLPLTPSPFHWGVIQLIGFCLLIVPSYARLAPPFRLLALLLPLLPASSLPLRPLTGGFTPFLPWASLFFTGFLLGGCAHRLQASSVRHPNFLLALAGLALSLPLAFFHRLTLPPFEWTHRSSPSIASLLGFSALFIILLALARTLLDRPAWQPPCCPLLHLFTGFGRHALTIYYIQLFALVLTARFYLLITGSLPRLPWLSYFPLTALALLLLHLAVNVIWAARSHVYSLEWFLASGIRLYQRTHARLHPQ